MYHGIDNVEHDPWSTFVSAEKFEHQINLLIKEFYIISLEDLTNNQLEISKPSVVITFDDGYANNLYKAKPLLEKYSIPATFFITSGYIGDHNEFWWDLLERIFLETTKLPEELVVEFQGSKKKWKIFNSSKKSLTKFFKVDKNDQQQFITSRTATLKSVRNKIKNLNYDERESIIKNLLEWAGIEEYCRETHRVLTSNELKKLARRELFEIGCHTLTHPVLSEIDMESQRNEILKSKNQLEEIIDNEIVGFSYPFGKEKHYNKDTLRILNEHGFNYACTSVEESISEGADIFQLPRIFVKDWDVEEFQKNIFSYFN
jgi:peptidoglycan/xylan/chitin deacetylase (PgdA/CDA1 family)